MFDTIRLHLRQHHERRKLGRRTSANRCVGSWTSAVTVSGATRVLCAFADRVGEADRSRDGAELVGRGSGSPISSGWREEPGPWAGRKNTGTPCSAAISLIRAASSSTALGHADRDLAVRSGPLQRDRVIGWGSRRPTSALGTSVIIRFVAMRCPRWRRSCLSAGSPSELLVSSLSSWWLMRLRLQQLSPTPTPSRWPRSAG